MKRITKTLLVLVVITIILWLSSKESFSQITDNPIKSIAQITALLGAVGYFVSYSLSSRLPFFERFMPLDQVYKVHRITGTLAGSGILLHVASLIVNLLPSTKALSLYLLPGSQLSYTLGIIAFYQLLVMLLTTLYVKLPYHLWNIVHKITSYSVIFATLHILLIPSDVANYLPLRIWMIFIMSLGVIGWFYRQFIYKHSAYRHEYIISSIEKNNSIVILSLTAIKNPLHVEPGQFAFFTFYDSAKKVTTESHPFTVLSSSPTTLHIAVKEVGDFTKTLHHLQKGTLVKVAGPHGYFGKHALNAKRPSIWIAGGIGITPFYNLVTNSRTLTHSLKNMSLFYTTTAPDQIFHPQLLKFSQEMGYSYHYTISSEGKRLTPESVLAQLNYPPTSYEYFLCGPKGLLTTMTSYLTEIGVKRSQIFTEDFDFKALES